MKFKGTKRRYASGGDVVFTRAFKDYVPKNLKQYMDGSELKEKAPKSEEKKAEKKADKPVKKATAPATAPASAPARVTTPATTPARAPATTPAAAPARASTTTAAPAPARQTNYFKDLRSSPKAGERKVDTSAADASRQATQEQFAATAEKIAKQRADREKRAKEKREATLRALGAIGDEIVGNLPGGESKGLARGGKVSSASKRADGCAIRGKTRAR